MRPTLLPFVSLLGLLVAGCPTPTQYGGPIAVDTDGFAARMAWLCHWGVHGGQDQACFDPHAKEKESAARDKADAGAPVKPVPAEDRPKPAARAVEKPADKPAPIDAGAAKEKEPADAAATPPSSPVPEAGAEPVKPEHDEPTPPEEPPAPPESPGEEGTRGK